MSEPAVAKSSASENAVPPTTPASPRKTTKRKIDEALHSLDVVLQPDDQTLAPAKKTRFRTSLYSTLAKYGIKTSKPQPSPKPDDLSHLQRTAPHLTAILARAASRKQKQKPEAHVAAPLPSSVAAYSSATEYRPSSTISFLSRLSSFKLATYSNKPTAIDAVACAKAGWVNDRKDRLACGICRSSWIVASRDGMTREAASALLEKQKKALVENHKDRCPWKSQQCDASIYCVPLKPPSTLAREIKKHALELDESDILDGVEVRHPLTTAQVNAFMSTLSSVQFPSAIEEAESEGDATAPTSQAQPPVSTQPGPSQTAALTALFGWTVPPPPSLSDARPMTPSTSRAGSVAPTVPSTPTTPRRVSGTFSSEAPDTPGPSRPTALRFSSAVTDGLHRRQSPKDRDSALLYCALCQRKVGLWAFKLSPSEPALPATPSSSTVSSTRPTVPATPSRAARRVSQLPKRQLDLLKEHRSYCPYVARSTSIPTLPSYAPSTTSLAASPQPPVPSRSNSLPTFSFSFTPRNAPPYPAPDQVDPSTVEGWRAVLTVVLRTGFGRRQRMRSLNLSRSNVSNTTTQGEGTGSEDQDRQGAEDPDRMEVDGIHAMVEGAKAHGPRDLLRYVKSLFA